MSQANKLLVITSEGYTSSSEHDKFTARAEVIAAKVGAELLVLGPGQAAFMLDGLTAPGEEAASEITGGLRHCSESREAYWGHALRSHVEPLKAIEGMALGVSLDPLESAIRETVSLLNDQAVFLAESNLTEVQRAGLKFLGEKLNSHLNHLLGAQLKRVTAHE
ncbi:Uncharacterised protein [Pseudomonas putida]|uniref:hypothetical protein n=1 Tax=Pseudomonas guariconensis TaxID=1288410 RepID=UPI001FA22671|nr:hypothetical protein [Pseudomonas guariconensis]CAB5583179.1 Uncharacterised protein [Pseudomonas putida]MDM9594667.1 hypothetical protein [Pseudomonas guariconensis]MDM9595314.1 hypothetical protein [Pseudomonas guariconensis]MDM9607497.1 hypothetical protein [Pseudomonas guariconensis]MDM9608144.1 hypothetical protein [Pseudomonas guariconensis]